MLTESKVLTLLEVVVPPDSAVTVSSEVKIIELLGIVSQPESLNYLRLGASMVPPNTQATLKGLVQLLAGLAKIHPQSTREHQATITDVINNLSKMPDVPLTYATFLPICATIMKSTSKPKREPPAKSSTK